MLSKLFLVIFAFLCSLDIATGARTKQTLKKIGTNVEMMLNMHDSGYKRKAPFLYHTET